MLEARLIEDVALLDQVLQLQRANLPGALSVEEARRQGFVTLEHTPELLRKMHAVLPSVVAMLDGQLVGYALSMARECRGLIPVLGPMFEVLDSVELDDRPLASRAYYVMGQVCVARPWRGRGVVEALYEAHRRAYSKRFELLVTEISERNPRSLAAHERLGFRVIHRYADATDSWLIVAWNWR